MRQRMDRLSYPLVFSANDPPPRPHSTSSTYDQAVRLNVFLSHLFFTGTSHFLQASWRFDSPRRMVYTNWSNLAARR